MQQLAIITKNSLAGSVVVLERDLGVIPYRGVPDPCQCAGVRVFNSRGYVDSVIGPMRQLAIPVDWLAPIGDREGEDEMLLAAGYPPDHNDGNQEDTAEG